jgi:predicted RNase H-like HicB family nuclease
MSKSSIEIGAKLIEIEIAIAIKRNEEEGCFYAWSPQLRCVRDGDTVEEALALCFEALEVLCESWLERDALEQHLSESGYTGIEEVVDGQPRLVYALKEGSLIPHSDNGDAAAFINAPFDDLYKVTIHPQPVRVGA